MKRVEVIKEMRRLFGENLEHWEKGGLIGDGRYSEIYTADEQQIKMCLVGCCARAIVNLRGGEPPVVYMSDEVYSLVRADATGTAVLIDLVECIKPPAQSEYVKSSIENFWKGVGSPIDPVVAYNDFDTTGKEDIQALLECAEKRAREQEGNEGNGRL